MLKCPHWSIQVPNQLFNLLRTDKIEREKNNFKVVYPGIFYSLISYSKAEKFNITSFFFTALNNESHLIPDDRASVGYNTIPKPLVTWPKVSVSTRPHFLISVMFSQILSIWKCWLGESIEETTSNSNMHTKTWNMPKKSLYSGNTVIPVKTTFICWCIPDHEQTTYKVFHKRGIGSGRCRLSALRTYQYGGDLGVDFLALADTVTVMGRHDYMSM